MFEAPLIRDLDPQVTPQQLAKAFLVIGLLTAAVGLVMNFMGVLYTGAVIAALAGIGLWAAKKFNKQHNPWKIQMSLTEVRVLHESGREVFQHRLDEIDGIDVPIGFALPNELILQPTRRMIGLDQQNHVIIKQDGDRHRYDFVLKSQRDLITLQKLVLAWQNQGYPVEKTVKISPGPFPGWLDDGRPADARG